MKIGFDISQTGQHKAGCGFLAYSLIRALAEVDHKNEYIQYPTFGDFYFDPEWKKSVKFVQQRNFQIGLGHEKFEQAKAFWAYPTADFETKLGSPDIIQSNNFFCPVGFKKTKLVYFLHDLIFLQEPDLTTEVNRIGCFQGVFRANLYADFVIANSNYSREKFLEYFPHYPEEKVEVVHLASRFSGQSDTPSVKPKRFSTLKEDGFWLNVGTLEPRKNQIGILKAYAKLKAELGPTYPLVFAGGRGWQMEHFNDVISDLGLDQDVIHLDYVSDQELLWLLQNCFAFVFPSFLEGFGLPVLEAMSQGAAVITSSTTSLPEIIGDCGLLIDPKNENELYKAMAKLQVNPTEREKFKHMALERSKLFSWGISARKILEIYNHIV